MRYFIVNETLGEIIENRGEPALQHSQWFGSLDEKGGQTQFLFYSPVSHSFKNCSPLQLLGMIDSSSCGEWKPSDLLQISDY